MKPFLIAGSTVGDILVGYGSPTIPKWSMYLLRQSIKAKESKLDNILLVKAIKALIIRIIRII